MTLIAKRCDFSRRHGGGLGCCGAVVPLKGQLVQPSFECCSGANSRAASGGLVGSANETFPRTPTPPALVRVTPRLFRPATAQGHA